MSSHKFLLHEAQDDVGVAVQDIKAGEEVMGVDIHSGKEFHVKSNHDIQLGHKIALKEKKKGENLIKYGENVGRVTEDIKVGDWVHTHNLKTARWDYGN
ncbi:UxaA family hydrolase [Dehalobacterium formicoaceticum]|uniref:UxaA family hydrolase n=1 Tax=Dehalobacterium formicoaceticum TaxID=51515 RepID=A0ABT1Y5E2_9FIRM|nr:UxaA family hydrolase [Dehalobacterium formicoaceticum]MCR6546092.1 UxaA family hydrolase [Dehalobacterium formicoaceticum]MCR6546095.1 UxaA family hydrolase [Dehalobacterium formicoaceticum]